MMQRWKGPVRDPGCKGIAPRPSGRSQARRLRRRRIYARRMRSFLASLNSTIRLRPSLYCVKPASRQVAA